MFSSRAFGWCFWETSNSFKGSMNRQVLPRNNKKIGLGKNKNNNKEKTPAGIKEKKEGVLGAWVWLSSFLISQVMRGPLTPSGASPRITQCRLPPAHFPHLFFSAAANNPFEHPPPSTNRHSVKTFREVKTVRLEGLEGLEFRLTIVAQTPTTIDFRFLDVRFPFGACFLRRASSKRKKYFVRVCVYIDELVVRTPVPH
ncbi:hypothetical protein TNCV_1373391 [Trichonephila clavipes]|uniref:Uncharacterized protein n=1 Tax=Trichonephila clavipes TaxID=2585209 RepID=A0A8X6WGP3_TRICX|nr:hypothetical protein TNCV_1373391 [Trichonephila clavipes]